MFADQLAQVALAGHKRDDRDRPVHPLRLDELRQLRAFGGYEIDISGAGGEPEDQLVQKQDDRAIAEPLRVMAYDRQPGIQADEGFAAGRGDVAIAAKEMRDQVGDEALPFFALGRLERRRLEA